VQRVVSRNDRFQTWQALLGNRNKRLRLGRFLVHGVRPISLALRYDWPVLELLVAADRRLSEWARAVLRDSGVPAVEVDEQLLMELGERADEPPELIAVASIRPDNLDRLAAPPGFLGLVFDRPASPGNLGTLIRSADAFGASGLIVSGHAADVYDPKTVRASTGSLFHLPVVRSPSPAEVLAWVTRHRAEGVPLRIVGTDEDGDTLLTECDLTAPTLLVVGNETAGMSARWRELCDQTVRIPIGGAASSLNAANAGTLVLYEAARQRGF
jgi:tRNA G18 (ribose-2'-O)-methylase SpoU